MKRRNIAVIIAAVDTDSQGQILGTIFNAARKDNVTVSAFSCFAGVGKSEKNNRGEFDIYSLVNYDLFDGVILVLNAIHSSEVRARIIEQAKGLTIPVVSIENKIDGISSVITDNYSAMKKIVNHFISEHHFNDIGYVSGPAENVESQLREKGYTDAVTENGFVVDINRIYHGDFYIVGGENAADYFMDSPKGMPQAIVCANDMMALALIERFKNSGINVPEDVLVSGFDGTDEGQRSYPSLTTMKCNYTAIGESAYNLIYEQIESGKREERHIVASTEFLLGESCGCRSVDVMNLRGRNKEAQKGYAFNLELTVNIMDLSQDLTDCDDLESFVETSQRFIRKINPKEFYFCANKGVFCTTSKDMDTPYNRCGYSEMMSVPIAYRNGEFVDCPDVPSAEIFPFYNGRIPVSHYIATPVHFTERNYGYFVFGDSDFPMFNVMYVSWLTGMCNALENIRKQEMLKTAMNALEEMYITDALTGIYNRFGLFRYYSRNIDKCAADGKKVMILFIDVDNLKSINDVFGHKEGDGIIRATAQILGRACTEGMFASRYGGDEFVVIGGADGEETVNRLCARIDEEIAAFNERGILKATLSMSVGYNIVDPKNAVDFDECIRPADKLMYDRKNERKRLKRLADEE